MSQVVLINVFEVIEGRDEEFLDQWKQGKQIMEQQQGYVSTALHRSLDPASQFRYINIAVWESAQDFAAALRNPDFLKYRQRFSFTSYPALYDVIRE